MKSNTSDWFEGLSQRERKDLVCLLFDIRDEVKKHQHYKLFMELMHRLDAEYHAMKGYLQQ